MDWFTDGSRTIFDRLGVQNLAQNAPRASPEGLDRGRDGAFGVKMARGEPKVARRCAHCGPDLARKAKIVRRERPRTTKLSKKPPKVTPKWSKNGSKIDLKTTQKSTLQFYTNLGRFLVDFLSIF